MLNVELDPETFGEPDDLKGKRLDSVQNSNRGMCQSDVKQQLYRGQ